MGNKNHLKNINDQNFSHFIRRGYDKGVYGIKADDLEESSVPNIHHEIEDPSNKIFYESSFLTDFSKQKDYKIQTAA